MDREMHKYITEDMGNLLKRKGLSVKKLPNGIDVTGYMSIELGGDNKVHIKRDIEEGGKEESCLTLPEFNSESDSILSELVDTHKLSRLANKVSYYVSTSDTKAIEQSISLLREEVLLQTQWGLEGPLKRSYESLKRASRVSKSGDALILALKRGLVPKEIASDVVVLLRSSGYSEGEIPKLYRGDMEE